MFLFFLFKTKTKNVTELKIEKVSNLTNQILHPQSDYPTPQSELRNLQSEHPTSNIRHQTSDIEHPNLKLTLKKLDP